MKNHWLILLLGCVVLALTACSQSANAPKSASTQPVLIVGTNAEYPPFSYIEQEEIIGFDIDIAKEVARRLNQEIQIKDMPFDALIPELVLGNVHIAAAGVSYTEERAKRVFFTSPHLDNDPFVIVTYDPSSTQSPLLLDQLPGKTVAVNEGYTADLFLSSIPNIQIVRLSAPADAFLALKSKRVDAFVTARSTLAPFLKTQDADTFHFSTIDNTGEKCALAVSRKHPIIYAQIEEVLIGMKQDGTIDQLKRKWGLQ